MDSAFQPSPSVPSSRAGVFENSSLACLRVWSMVDSGVRVRPAASPSTANRLTEPPTRAATMIRLAVWPSSTNIFVPESL